jgi:DNA polymerase-4
VAGVTGGPAILFVEVPSLYAEVELRDAPDLAGRALLVGGDPAKRGRLQSASREALLAGVQIGESMQEALTCCPDAVVLRTDMPRYREVAGALRVSMRRVTESLEPAGLGAAYVDSRSTALAPEALAEALIARVRDDLSLPLRVGVAPTKLVARLLAETLSGGESRRVESGAVAEFLDPLPLARLPRVGRKAIERLAALGARSVGELRGLKPEDVESSLGNHGLSILEQAEGGQPGRVRGARHPATISRSVTLAVAGETGVTPAFRLADALRRLARDLELSLTRQGLHSARIALRLGFEAGPPVTRSMTHGEAEGGEASILSAAEALLARVEPEDRLNVRTLTLRVAGLHTPEGALSQLELF